MGYDIAQRPVERWVTNPGSGNEVLKVKTVYGEGATNARIDNLLGQIFEQYDQAGKIRNAEFDFKTNPKEENRQFAQVFNAVLDYSGNVPLNAEIYTTTYAYDALNRPTEKTTPDDSTCKYAYAKNAMLQSQSVDVGGSGTDSPAITNIKYNARGQRTDIYYANATKTKYEYDPATFRIIRILTRNSGADILQDLNYTYDAVGNITQMKDDAQQTIYFANQVVLPKSKYTYDSLYRLKKATGRELNGLNQPSAGDCPIQTPVPDTETNACRNYTLNYDYDELGNILKIKHTAQNGNWKRDYFYPTDSNKLIGHEDGQTDYTYDEAGNMLSMPHLNVLTWDEDNMLVETDLGGGGTAYYRYDSGGNRVRKVIVNGSVKKERLYVDDWELWQQSSSGTVQTERETLSISDDQKSFLQLETLTIENGSAVSAPVTNWRYQYDNHLGSACLELDGTASVISYEEYFPFGVTSYRSGKSISEVSLKKYRYCGKERDEETELYYYGARFYAAWIGRFISVDPLASDYPQLSPYNYASNNPVTHKDVDGMQNGDEETVDDMENTQAGNPPPVHSSLAGNPENQNSATEKSDVHTVVKGDTLSEIAADNNISTKELRDINDLDPANDRKLQIGTKLEMKPSKIRERISSYSLKDNPNRFKNGNISSICSNSCSSTQANTNNSASNSQNPNVTFEAGKTYDINIEAVEIVNVAGSSLGWWEAQYNGMEAKSDFGGSVGAGGELGLFSRYKVSRITFYETLSGDSFADALNQTGKIELINVGPIVQGNYMKGYSLYETRLQWESDWDVGGGWSGSVTPSGSFQVVEFKDK